MPTSLTAVSWIINNRCNLKCLHCYTKSIQDTEVKPSYSKEDIADMARNIGSVNPKIVIISGGEPLLDKDLPLFLSEARKIASKELWICTNGALISDKFIELFKKIKIDGVTLSLRHHDPLKEGQISQNSGVYKKVLFAIEKIKKAGIHVALEMTIMKLNYDSVDDFIRLGIDKKVDLILFKRFRPIGRGKENNLLILTKTENKEILHHIFLKAQQELTANIKVDDPLYSLEIDKYLEEHANNEAGLPEYMRRFASVRKSIVPDFDYCSAIQIDDNESQRYWGCKAGIEWVGIDPLGNVSPCPLLLYTGLIIGNIKEQPLFDIIETSSVIKALKNGYNNGKCSKCKVCGGCRSHAAAIGAGYLSKDPMCIEKSKECF